MSGCPLLHGEGRWVVAGDTDKEKAASEGVHHGRAMVIAHAADGV